MTIYAAHQPDLLPYSGFWYKMAKADVFDLKIWDQFVDSRATSVASRCATSG